MKEKYFSIFMTILLLIGMCIPIVKAEDIASQEETENPITVSYYTHIQDIGWEKEFCHKNGEMAGTVGMAKPIEAVVIKSENLPEGIKLKYKAHVRDIGWQTWKNNGEMAGTTGRAKSIEALQIKLENTKDYTIEYRAHVRDIGWQKWVTDGEIAGTTGRAKPIEAIQIRITRRKGSISYQAHVSQIGWKDWNSDGEVAGTTGQAKPIEALKIKTGNFEQLGIEYQAHVQDIGWMNWVNEGEQAGTTGRAKPMEAIRIRFKKYSEDYSLVYRVHVRDIGWMDWVYEGEQAGTTGRAKSIEAIQIKIITRPDNMKVKMYSDNPVTNIDNYCTTEKIRGWVMTSLNGTKINIKIDNKTVDNIANLKRTQRADVIAAIQGYGGKEKNPTPGYELDIDFSKYDTGVHTLAIQVISKDGEILKQEVRKINIIGVYGSSGLVYKGDNRGSKLTYYKFGNGPNVLFATFAVHGFEDKWSHDGVELVTIAEDFNNRLKNGNYQDISQKWTVYILPEVNPDGRRYGYTNNGPGRTTLFSQAPGNKGVDLNRCWQINGVPYTRYTDARNYNGTAGFQAYEAQALRDFMLNNQSRNGQTVVIDLHGWTNQLIGDSNICMSYYYPRFQSADRSALGRYGTGYLVNWARSTLRSSSATARSALIELPSNGINNHQDVINNNLSNRYIDSTIEMLRNLAVPNSARKAVRSIQSNNTVLEIDSEKQYKIALAGMIKQQKPEESEIENLVSYKADGNGVWVSKNSREKFEQFLNDITNQEYKINEMGYLEIVKESKNKNSYDIAIEDAINSNKEYIIDMTGNYYFVDHMTGNIENNPFEIMDEYQIYEYVEANNKMAVIITSNKDRKLSNKEIADSFIELLKVEK